MIIVIVTFIITVMIVNKLLTDEELPICSIFIVDTGSMTILLLLHM